MRRRLATASTVAAAIMEYDSSDESDTSMETDDDEEGEQYEASEVYGTFTRVYPGADDFNGFPDFLGDNGVRRDIQLPSDAENSISFYIDLFFTDSLIQHLVECTNKRAEIELDRTLENVGPDGTIPVMLSQWKMVSSMEMKKVIGILFIMAINHKPELKLYWSQNIIYKSEIFQSPQCLTRDRFLQIMKYLRFSNPESLDLNDPLARIREFADKVNCINQSVYHPERDVAVDESLMKWKGRSILRRYVPTKRARYGLMTMCLCESSTGYTYKFLICANSTENQRIASDIPGCDVLSYSERIVVELMRNILDKGYHVHTDNYFSSVRLAQFLSSRSTMMTGTLRPNRGAPSEVRNVSVPVKQSFFFRQENILLVKAVDKKASGLKTIFFLDTANSAQTRETTQRRKGGKLSSFKNRLRVSFIQREWVVWIKETQRYTHTTYIVSHSDGSKNLEFISCNY